MDMRSGHGGPDLGGRPLLAKLTQLHADVDRAHRILQHFPEVCCHDVRPLGQHRVDVPVGGHHHCDGVVDEPERHVLVEKIRSEEHTSELQSLMRISYAVFCLKKKKKQKKQTL